MVLGLSLYVLTSSGTAGAQSPLLGQVRVNLSPAQEHYRERITLAATESFTQYSQWIGPPPPGAVTIRSIEAAADANANRELIVELPWRAAASTMEVEAQVAYVIALSYLPRAENAAMGRGLAWYLQSRIVERLFNLGYAQPAHSTAGSRFFGGFVPWGYRSLQRTRWVGGLSWERHAVRPLSPAAWPARDSRLPPGVDRDTIRAALAFATLERYLGWPALRSALRLLTPAAGNARLSVEEVAAIVGDAVGRDLRWFFASAIDPRVDIDYAVTGFRTTAAPACGSGTCYRTEVTIARLGDGLFTGTSRAPVDAFEAGTGIVVRVDFEQGESVVARWDGRAAERAFVFESPSAATAVRLDPDGTLLLDPTPLDHTRFAVPQTNVPIAKWISRWIVWLQDAMLSYSMLV